MCYEWDISSLTTIYHVRYNKYCYAQKTHTHFVDHNSSLKNEKPICKRMEITLFIIYTWKITLVREEIGAIMSQRDTSR